MSYLLLTGATGLLGRFVLRDLLLADQRIAVLARGSVTASARHRVDALLRQWESVYGRPLPRPVVLEGNITQPLLGLDAESLHWVARHCDALIHSAASLTFETNAASGEPWLSNVRGTEQVLELCRQTGVRRLFQVSTAYVCGQSAGVIQETPCRLDGPFSNAYETSKAQAEQRVLAAPFLDAPTILRPSIIVGDTQTGFTPTYHGFYTPLKLAHELARNPARFHAAAKVPFLEQLELSGHERKNLVPVDWVAAVTAHIVLHPELHGKIYHLTNPRAVPARRIWPGRFSNRFH